MVTPHILITPETRHGRGGSRTIWVIRRNGKFIIGAVTEQHAKEHLTELGKNGWKFLDCYERGHPDPLEWIAHVRSHSWTLENLSEVQICDDGRAFFSGNLKEVSAAFRYLILDTSILEQVKRAAPEVPVNL